MPPQIQNFRLQVVQTSEPLVARIRYTPPAANKPTRMEKDLEQAKKLAAVLEARAAEVSTYKPVFAVGAPVSPPENDEAPTDAPEKPDGNEMDQDDVEPSRGSKAVEDRIDKIASETLDTDENGNPDREKHVSTATVSYTRPVTDTLVSGDAFSGYVSFLFTRSFSLLLLLCGCRRPRRGTSS